MKSQCRPDSDFDRNVQTKTLQESKQTMHVSIRISHDRNQDIVNECGILFCEIFPWIETRDIGIQKKMISILNS